MEITVAFIKPQGDLSEDGETVMEHSSCQWVDEKRDSGSFGCFQTFLSNLFAVTGKRFLLFLAFFGEQSPLKPDSD